ncbi:MAG: CxxC-x17-CxxC domain-containing protein [Candidatus Paceibacterota bacterium]
MRKDTKKTFDNDSFGMHQAVCADCGKKCEIPFKPSSDRPVYCDDCFRSKRESRNSGGGGSSFGRGGSGSSYGGGGRGDFRRSDRDKRMYSATCSGCGARCEVPFQPTSGKPVYCNDCFKRDGSGRNDRGGGGGQGQITNQLAALNSKLDRILKILSPSEPVKVVEVVEKKKIMKEVNKPELKNAIKNAQEDVIPETPKKEKEKKVAKKSAKKAKAKK